MKKIKKFNFNKDVVTNLNNLEMGELKGGAGQETNDCAAPASVTSSGWDYSLHAPCTYQGCTPTESTWYQ